MENNLIFSLTIDGEPLSPVNQYSARAINKFGRWTAMMYLPAKYVKYKKHIVTLAENAKDDMIVYEGDVRAEAVFYFGTKRRKDLSNAGKLEWDALNEIVYKDDSQILELNTKKRYDKANPRTEIKIFKYPSGHWPTD